MEHHFNTTIAKKYGINEAIIIHNFYFWIERNRANEKHFHEGRTWTYNSMSALQQLFPYMTKDVLRRAIERLIKSGVVISGNFNKAKYDRTLWYSLSDEINSYYTINEEIAVSGETTDENCQLHLASTPNGFGTDASPIPDINTDNKLFNTADIPPELIAKEMEKRKSGKRKDAVAEKAGVSEKDLLWKSHINTWLEFYKEKTGIYPVINPREAKSLKLLAAQLRKRAEEKSVPWNVDNAHERLKKFFICAHDKDDWLRRNFSISNCYNQINAIIQIIEHGNKQTGTNTKRHGKSAGAISFANRVRQQFEQKGT